MLGLGAFKKGLPSFPFLNDVPTAYQGPWSGGGRAGMAAARPQEGAPPPPVSTGELAGTEPRSPGYLRELDVQLEALLNSERADTTDRRAAAASLIAPAFAGRVVARALTQVLSPWVTLPTELQLHVLEFAVAAQLGLDARLIGHWFGVSCDWRACLFTLRSRWRGEENTTMIPRPRFNGEGRQTLDTYFPQVGVTSPRDRAILRTFSGHTSMEFVFHETRGKCGTCVFAVKAGPSSVVRFGITDERVYEFPNIDLFPGCRVGNVIDVIWGKHFAVLFGDEGKLLVVPYRNHHSRDYAVRDYKTGPARPRGIYPCRRAGHIVHEDRKSLRLRYISPQNVLRTEDLISAACPVDGTGETGSLRPYGDWFIYSFLRDGTLVISPSSIAALIHIGPGGDHLRTTPYGYAATAICTSDHVDIAELADGFVAVVRRVPIQTMWVTILHPAGRVYSERSQPAR